MAFSVRTNNRFDLFVDEDQESDDLLTQQQQLKSERQRKDSDKKSTRATSGGKQAPAKGQPQVKANSNAASSSGKGIRSVTWI